MIRDEDGALTGYVYIDLNTKDYGGFVTCASRLAQAKTRLASRLYLQMVRRIRV
jgi:copper/silver efflux system protein